MAGVSHNETFDFIVVGAGSAGSAVTGRLVEAGHKVSQFFFKYHSLYLQVQEGRTGGPNGGLVPPISGLIKTNAFSIKFCVSCT